VEAVDWQHYFESIRSACPWSYTAWRRGAIAITLWRGIITPLGSWKARLYLAPKHNPRQLRKMSERFNRERPEDEWLYSHPRFGVNSTPVPCFIQQDRQKLENIRLNMRKE
jgi:hypothetical protein